jgi:intracellular septation protein
MKFLFDILPLLMFFASYKIAGLDPESAQAFVNLHMSTLISGGVVTAKEAPMVIGTFVAILAISIQVLYLKLRGRKVDTLLWMSLGLFVLLGGMTIYFHDQDFIKWKFSIVYWLMGASLLISEVLFKKNLMRNAMEHVVQLPDQVWSRLNQAWICFFTVMGILNWYVAFVMYKDDFSSWLSFKTFGSTSLMFIFIVGQTIYLSRHIKDEA